MRTKLTSMVYLISACAVLFVGACSNKDQQVDGLTDIAIGFVTPLSGGVADLGREMLQSANLAIDDANRKNSEITYRLIARDDQTDVVAATTATRGMIDRDHVVAIIGAGESGVVRAEIEAAERSGVAVVTPTATLTSLAAGKRNIFRVIPPNSAQGRSLAGFAMKDLNASRAAIIFQQNDYALDLKRAFSESFEGQGGEITLEVSFETDETDFRVQLDRIAHSGCEVILCSAQHVPVSRILIRAREMGIEQPIISGETAFTQNVLEATGGQISDNFYLTGPAIDLRNPTSTLQDFIAKYKEVVGREPGIYGCYAYDAVGVIINAITRNGSSSDLLDRIASTTNYEGITGLITFDEDGSVARTYKMYTIRDNVFVPVDPQTSY
ncbi:ABC transporter substrate-binding protein [Gemmatimonadota bacterium]